jgi:hypothetical protein
VDAPAARQAVTELTTLLPMLRRLPRRVEWIASAAENGWVTATVSLYQLLGYNLLVVCAILALRVLVLMFGPRPLTRGGSPGSSAPGPAASGSSRRRR